MIKTYTPLLYQSKLIILIGIMLTSFSAKGQWTPLNVNMNSNFADVQFLNDSVGFVTGSYGAILKTIDGGLNWVNTNNTGSLYSFKIIFQLKTQDMH